MSSTRLWRSALWSRPRSSSSRPVRFGRSFRTSMPSPNACNASSGPPTLYVAARDRTYGEDPGWRLWLATIVAAAATAACFATLRTASSETVTVPLIGEDPSGVTAQVAAFWLISSGVAILVTAQTPVRGSLGALLMITGVELLVRLLTVPQLGLSLLLGWVEVVIALAGGFLIVNERVVREN